MSNDDAATCNLGHERGESFGNVFIREPVEPVAPNALLIELIGYRVAVRDVVMAAMKGCIEAGNLRELWKARKSSFDRRETVRLVQRCERNQTLQSRDHAVVDKYGSVIVGTPMHHAVPDGDWHDPMFLAQPGFCHHQCGGHIRDTSREQLKSANVSP
jgi:hypothetical protein